MRVRGIDRVGLEGFSADRAITVHARPEPPTLIDPPADAQIVDERPTLRWTGVDRATRYRLQVSNAATFETTIVDAPTIDATTLQAPMPLAAGPWFWRVSTFEPQVGQGPFSDVQSFRRVLPAPGVELPALTGDPLDLRWRSMGDGVRYRVQLARDTSFDEPLVDAVVADPRYPLTRPPPGRYHLRVASIAPDGHPGPWGSAQTLTIADASTPWWPVLLFVIPLFFL